MPDSTNSNIKLWDELVPVHAASKYYDLAAFKAGRSSLRSIEQNELGSVFGKSLLHLQCHFGQDSVCLSRLGARVTGIDYSPAAIAFAQSLSAEMQTDIVFVCADVCNCLPLLTDPVSALAESFDIVFTSYGVLPWLSDLRSWARLIAGSLKPGGSFYIVESHPILHLFKDDETGTGLLVKRANYFYTTEPSAIKVEGSYADGGAKLKQTVKYKWHHSLEQILSALAEAGLSLDFFHEHRLCSFQKFQCMQQGDDGWWRFNPASKITLPLSFSLKATKLAR